MRYLNHAGHASFPSKPLVHIEPRHRGSSEVLKNFRALLRAREILYMLAWRDIRVRYKQSVMGLMWAILMPSLIVGAGVLVRIAAARYTGTAVGTNDLASIMIRAIAWSFFISTIRFGTNSLIGNPNLVTKLAFPKEVFPLAAALSSLFDSLVAGAAVLVLLLLLGWLPSWEILWAIPLLTLLFLLSAGLAMLLAAANLFFRDVKYLVEIFLTYAIFFTPVLYEASVAGKWQPFILANPIAPLLEALASVFVWHRGPDPFWTAYSAVTTLLVVLVGYWAFKRLEADFAESI
jgi:ABC-type polysaccharide/polyol phosphate export permease